ncbi:MAG TPA: hybrid sensor histidine kinase/response regulator [Candidatus Sulfotelmatobacter sp.]|nr:hybrid sensor histidine kinase/response regulator [Candidatus Sulfotelmatobacter sp.]
MNRNGKHSGDIVRSDSRSDSNGPAHARILVVDDQASNVQVVGLILGTLGYEIIPASDGATALKRVAALVPDLILLDLLMPGMSGRDVCLQIKKNPDWLDIPVIFLSAADDKDLIVSALDAGGVDYITKPFNQAELVSRVRTQLALKAARDRLKELAEDKDELLGILAHDLKNHLGGLNMSTKLLCERIRNLHDERIQRLADNAFYSSGQLLAFVKDFLANAAAEHRFEPQLTTVDISGTAVAAIRLFEDRLRHKQLEIQTDFPDDELIAHADAHAMDQIFSNLLSNAVKFSPYGKKIFVTVRSSGHWVESSIRDEGPGFTEADKARMFRRYGRLSARPTGGETSTGLGLSIVRKLVLAMNGEITCESAPGQGATLTVRLPKAKN